MTAQLKRPGSGALDLDLIGWDPGPFIHDATTMICPVSHGQSSSSSAGAVPEEGGLVITGSRAGAGATAKLRTEPVPLTVGGAEAEQDAVQTRVRKGPAQPTQEPIMKRNATRLPSACWTSRGKRQTAALASHPLNRCGDTDILTVLNFLH